MSLKKTAIKGVVWSGIRNWGSQAGSLIVFFVLARLLSPIDFGLVALANTFLSFFSIFMEQGLTSALIQREKIEEEHLNTVFWIQVCIGSSLAIVSFFNASLIAQIYKQPLLIPILQSFSFLFFINSLNAVQRAILTRKLAFKTIAIRSLSGIVIGGIVGIYLAVYNFGVWSLVAQQLTFEIVGVIAFWSISNWRPKLQFSWSHFKELFAFGIPIFYSKILVFFNQNTDNLLIGYFLGEVALGYYAIAYKVLQVLTQLLVGTVRQVALPVLSRLQLESERFVKVFYQIIKLASAIALPIFLGVIILANELVLIIFDVKWQPSIPIMQVLAFGGIFNLILFFNQSAFVAIGKPFWQLRLDILNVLSNIVACVIAVRYGILAVSFAYIVSDFIVIPVSIWSLKKTINISIKTYFIYIAYPAVCGTIMIILIYLVKHLLITEVNAVIILLISTISGILFYAISLKLLAPFLFDDLWQLVNFKLLKNTSKGSKKA